MKIKYLILIIFGFILNNINAVTCADIEEGLAKFTVSKKKILILNTSTNKIVFFYINKNIYTLITNIGAYVYYHSCLENSLTFYNIQNTRVHYDLNFDEEKSSIKTEDLPVDNDGSKLKANIFDRYKLANGVKESIYKEDDIEPLLNSQEKTFLHKSEDDLLPHITALGEDEIGDDVYNKDEFLSKDFFHEEDSDSNNEEPSAKRIKLTPQVASHTMQIRSKATHLTHTPAISGKSNVASSQLEPIIREGTHNYSEKIKGKNMLGWVTCIEQSSLVPKKLIDESAKCNHTNIEDNFKETYFTKEVGEKIEDLYYIKDKVSGLGYRQKMTIQILQDGGPKYKKYVSMVIKLDPDKGENVYYDIDLFLHDDYNDVTYISSIKHAIINFKKDSYLTLIEINTDANDIADKEVFAYLTARVYITNDNQTMSVAHNKISDNENNIDWDDIEPFIANDNTYHQPLTHKHNEIAGSSFSQDLQDKRMEKTIGAVARDEPSNSHEIATESSGAEAIGSNPLINELHETIDNKDVLKFNDISIYNTSAIQGIIKNLAENQSIELTAPRKDSLTNKYISIIIKIDKKRLDKPDYSITLIDKNGKKKAFICSKIILTIDRSYLRIKFSNRNSDPLVVVINDTVKKIIDGEISQSITNYELKISTTLSFKEKLDEIKDYTQIINDLNHENGKNFVSIIPNITENDHITIDRLIKNLNSQGVLIFLKNETVYSKKNYEKIKITTTQKENASNKIKYYNIDITKEGKVTGLKNEHISINSQGKYIHMLIRHTLNYETTTTVLTIRDFHLFSSEDSHK